MKKSLARIAEIGYRTDGIIICDHSTGLIETDVRRSIRLYSGGKHMSDYIKTLRKSVGHAPILQCGASVIIVNGDGKILLQKRHDNGCWGFHGGAVELGEAVEEAARRELFEETGIVAGSLKLFGVFSGEDTRYVYPNGDEVFNVDIVYICRDFSGELKAEPGEVDELRYFDLDDLPDNITPPQRGAFNEYARREKTAVAKKILTNWSIPQDLPVAHISGNVFGVGSDYILKSGRREWILRNIQLTKALAGQGLSVGEPIMTKFGADYADGDPVWVLYRSVKGEPLSVSDRFGDKCGEFAFGYGAAIAKLHNALAVIDENVNVDDVDLFRHVAEWALPKANADEQFSRDYTAAFRGLCRQLPKQLIHRDTHPENIMWREGEVSGFIDFDIAQRNVRLWDVCYCSTALLSDCPTGEREKWFEVLREVLRGYDSVSPLTDAEKQSVYYVICSVQLVFVAWGDEQAEMTKVNRELLEFVITNKTRIAGIAAQF
jgi:8-oxo-dGTP pyrophosphatase MutT (NUDIX family)/Ser/Thr protein kinase RdoA (MazF antagonist)